MDDGWGPQAVLPQHAYGEVDQRYLPIGVPPEFINQQQTTSRGMRYTPQRYGQHLRHMNSRHITGAEAAMGIRIQFLSVFSEG